MLSQLFQNIAIKYLPVSFLKRRLAKNTTETRPATNIDKQLLIDVSVISKADAGTGIQRVVRNLYQELLAAPPAGYQVRPVAGTRKQGYCYLPVNFLQSPTKNPDDLRGVSVQVCAGDLFLGLDLAAHIVPHRMGELLQWKQQGVRMCFIVYDLLPVLEPTWFNPKTTQNFRRWLRAIAILADDAVAISRTVQSEFADWMQDIYSLNEYDLPCTTIQLGAELNIIQSNQTTSELLPPWIRNKFILMVGTIEPRKGHADVLDAFDQLWTAGNGTILVIAGKQGWKVEAFMQRLQIHPEAGKRLHWLNSPSDELLQELYQHCNGLIMASKGEGFGLPLMEAAYFKKPLLIRDIPVFREVAGNAASYFTTTEHNHLKQVLPEWLIKLDSKSQESEITSAWVTWKESSAQLVRALLPSSLEIHGHVDTAGQTMIKAFSYIKIE